MSVPVFLNIAQVNQLHRRSLEEFGGVDGLREPGLLDSALASAQNTYYYGRGDLYDVAATYAYHIAESQPFLDGNKRTAVASAFVFLAQNGAYATVPKWKMFAAMMAVASKELTKQGLARLLRDAASGENQEHEAERID